MNEITKAILEAELKRAHEYKEIYEEDVRVAELTLSGAQASLRQARNTVFAIEEELKNAARDELAAA